MRKHQSLKRKKITKKTRRIKRSSGLYIAPSFLGVLLFFVLPFMVVIYYSLVDNPISGNFVFLDNFRNIVRNAAFRQAVKNTAHANMSVVTNASRITVNNFRLLMVWPP